MRYSIIIVLTLLISSPAHAGDGLWTLLKRGLERATDLSLADLQARLDDYAMRDRATREILVAAEVLARRGSHPGERVEMAVAIATAWVEAERPEEARRVLARFSGEVDRIPTKATRSRALYELGKGWAMADDREQAEAIAAKVPRPDAILAELGAVRGEAGDVQAALALAERVEDAGAKGKLLGRTARARVRAGDIEGALALLDRIEHIPWRSSIIQAVAVDKAEAGDCAAARAMADRLNGVPGIAPSTIDLTGGAARRSPYPRVLAKVAVACAQGGDLDGAAQAASELSPGRQQVGVLAGLAAVAKDEGRAGRLLFEARGRADEIAEPGIRAKALVSVARAWKSRGNTDATIEVLDAAWDVAQKIAKASIGDARLEILAMLGEAGRCSDAKERARSLDTAFWQDGALASAARGCAQGGRTEAAMALAASTAVPLWRANAYQEIALALLEAGDIVAALGAVRQVPSERGRVKALATLGAAHLKAGGEPAAGMADVLAELLAAED